MGELTHAEAKTEAESEENADGDDAEAFTATENAGRAAEGGYSDAIAAPVPVASFLAALPAACSRNGALLPALGYCWSQTPDEVQKERAMGMPFYEGLSCQSYALSSWSYP